MSGFADKLHIQNSINSTGNSVHLLYGLSGFAYQEMRKLHIKKCVNSKGIVDIICMEL